MSKASKIIYISCGAAILSAIICMIISGITIQNCPIYDFDGIDDEGEISIVAETEEHLKIDNNIEPYSYIRLTPTELRDLAALVTLEVDNESMECKEAVTSVIVNRMADGDKSLYEVIYATDQFSPAHLIKDTEPSADSMTAVYNVTTYGPTLPEYVTFFRADYYHDWDEDRYIQYKVIDNTYFSYDKLLRDEYIAYRGPCYLDGNSNV